MSLWPAVSLITYVGLSIGLVVVLEEPYNLYKKNDTTKIADTIESEGEKGRQGKVNLKYALFFLLLLFQDLESASTRRS